MSDAARVRRASLGAVARLEAVRDARARFSRATSEDERARAVLDELDVLLDDAWARAIASSALSPALLGAMVAAGRLAFEQLEECLERDPQWELGIGSLVSSLSDEQAAALDARLDDEARERLRTVLLLRGRAAPGDVSFDSLQTVYSLGGGERVPSRLRASYADEALRRLSADPAPTLAVSSEMLSLHTWLPRDEARAQRARELVARSLALIEQEPPEEQALLSVARGALVRAYLWLGEDVLARQTAEQLLQVTSEAASFEQLSGVVDYCESVAPEESAAVQRALLDRLSASENLLAWSRVMARLGRENVGYAESFDRLVERWLERLPLMSSGRGRVFEGRRGLYVDVASIAKLLSPSQLDRFAEFAARDVEGEDDLTMIVALLAMARAGSRSAQSFIERTSEQGSVRWWIDPSTAYEGLPKRTLDAVLDGALRAHKIRWPVSTADALRWVSRDLSNSCAVLLERLVGGPPIEHRIERVVRALTKTLARTTRWLRDGATRDGEASLLAAAIGRGELAASPLFDRVWWEIGPSAQRAAWLARPTRADVTGAIVARVVVESIAGSACADTYCVRLEAWVARVARACAVR
jgi:hypothetical protein